jgi:solute carrier family 30 (zinc transporter), member 2
MSLLGISIGLAYEAMVRIYDMSVVTVDYADESATTEPTGTGTTPLHQINGQLMSIIAFIGVLVNLTLAYVLGEHHVHLPSDDGCDHGHSHDHHDHHDHHDSDHHGTSSDQNNNLKTTATVTDHHGHSHDHHQHHHDSNDHHSHDHGSCTTNESVPTLQQQEPHTESTPLLLDHTTKASHSNDNINHERAPAQQQKPKWKIPFSPQNINLQAAYLHVLGDLAQSITVLLAGCIIWVAPSCTVIDPICTLLFCVLVFYSAYGVCRTSIAVLLQQVPSHLDFHSVREKIASVPHVQDVHDLHIWSISHRVPALTVHVTIAYPEVDPTVTTTNTATKPLHDEVLENIYKIVRCEYDIVHATIQIQSTDGDCVTCVDRLCRPCLLDDMPTYPDAHVV